MAADRTGQLGAFITAGVAPIPVKVLSDTTVPIEEVEELIYRLPKTGAVQLLTKVKRPSSFIKLAERGLFVFDWTDLHRSNSRLIRAYELVAVPIPPKTIEHLPRELGNLARIVMFSAVSFGDQACLDVCEYEDCIEGE